MGRTSRTSAAAGVLIVILGWVGVCRSQSHAPTFKEYPALAIFRGAPAKPLLKTELEHTYRTQIRTQARNGPNFAGHFTLAKWGCGSPCVLLVIVDARTGAIFDHAEPVGCADKNGIEAIVDFRLGSRLITATGYSNKLGSGTEFYEWDGKQLNLLHFEPWPKSR